MIDATSFETEEILPLKPDQPATHIEVDSLFFDPRGATLYAEHGGVLYEWDLQKNKYAPEWWIGE